MTKSSPGVTIAGLDIGTTKTCAVVAARRPERPRDRRRRRSALDRHAQRRRHRPRGDDQVDRGGDRAGRADGGRPHLARLRRHHRRAHSAARTTAPSSRSRATIARWSRGDVRRVVDASKIINLAADRQIIHALPRYFTRRRSRGRRAIRSAWPAAASKSTRTSSPAARPSSPTCSSACTAPASKPAGLVFEPLASSAATLLAGREARRRGAARHRRRHDRHRRLFAAAARSTPRRFRSAATSSPTTSRSA